MLKFQLCSSGKKALFRTQLPLPVGPFVVTARPLNSAFSDDNLFKLIDYRYCHDQCLYKYAPRLYCEHVWILLFLHRCEAERAHRNLKKHQFFKFVNLSQLNLKQISMINSEISKYSVSPLDSQKPTASAKIIISFDLKNQTFI